jgi:hypothetical protein
MKIEVNFIMLLGFLFLVLPFSIFGQNTNSALSQQAKPCCFVEMKSIRKINLTVLDTDKNGKSYRKKVKKVSLTFQTSGIYIKPDSNISYSVSIGNKAFFAGGGGNICIVEMSQEEYDSLEDGAFINLLPGVSPGDAETQLKKEYKNGEPKEIADRKCCRFDKKMIDKAPVIERTKGPFLTLLRIF